MHTFKLNNIHDIQVSLPELQGYLLTIHDAVSFVGHNTYYVFYKHLMTTFLTTNKQFRMSKHDAIDTAS